MARARRKGNQGHGVAEDSRGTRSNVPEDTNVAILLPKGGDSQQARVIVQAAESGKKMSGKKRKRLEKYMENKRRKEETASLIKKLAERTIDTSSLSSTKTIGQLGRTGTQKRRAHRPSNVVESIVEISESSQSESESYNEIFEAQSRKNTSSILHEVPEETATAVVGGALKSNGFSVAKRRSKKTSTGQTWRARMQEAKGMPEIESDMSDEASEYSESGSESEQYSEWTGLSDSDTHSNAVDGKAEELPANSVETDTSGSDDDDEENVNSELNDGQDAETIQERAKQFTDWARRQSGFGGSAPNLSSLPRTPKELRKPVEPVPGKPPLTSDVPKKKSFYVRVERDPGIQTSRLALPIVAEEQQIMETLSVHDCLVICGETGSGKTTQLPQFLFEAGYGVKGSERPGLIGVTQPRRVAAVSMCSRVAEELGSEHGHRVGYQIRFDVAVNPDTAIKFMTDGVLLREVAQDLLLKNYSAIIVDEAHERSVNTDVLIGVLSRVVKLRREMSLEKDSTVKPLKLIIMSATLRVTDFTANAHLFPEPPPVINVEARQYPVTIHFSKKTNLDDYVTEAFKKVSKIHQRLPPGGILVFLTGQEEIRNLVKRLREKFPLPSNKVLDEGNEWAPPVKISAKNMDLELEDVDVDVDPSADNRTSNHSSDDEDDSDLSDFEAAANESLTAAEPLHVLPLFSLLPVTEQLKIFQPPPDGSRLCVVATNVAETSLTIPGIKYVVDCGRVKQREYDKRTGVESFQVGWVSKASAGQRSGRAGRIGAGHCYRLYSSTVFERDFSTFAEPEILKYPIEGIVLQMKGMNIDKVVNFPFPTPPDRESLQQAERVLENLGALDKAKHISAIGYSMSRFPLLPRYSKMIILGQQFGNMPYIISIVSGLSIGDPFISLDEMEGFKLKDDDEVEVESEALRSTRRQFEKIRDQFSALDPGCDVIHLLCAIGAYEAAGATDEFCQRHFLRVKTMREIQKLRVQITNIVNNQLAGIVAPVEFSSNLPPPSAVQIKTIKQIVAAGYLDHIAIRTDLLESVASKRNPVNVLRAEYSPLSTLSGNNEHRGTFIHPNSALAKLPVAPEYVVYRDLKESQNTGRLRLLTLMSIAARDIERLAKGTPLIQYSKPLNYPPPRIFTEDGVMKKEVCVVPRFGMQGKGWELPSVKRVEAVRGN